MFVVVLLTKHTRTKLVGLVALLGELQAAEDDHVLEVVGLLEAHAAPVVVHGVLLGDLQGARLVAGVGDGAAAEDDDLGVQEVDDGGEGEAAVEGALVEDGQGLLVLLVDAADEGLGVAAHAAEHRDAGEEVVAGLDAALALPGEEGDEAGLAGPALGAHDEGAVGPHAHADARADHDDRHGDLLGVEAGLVVGSGLAVVDEVALVAVRAELLLGDSLDVSDVGGVDEDAVVHVAGDGHADVLGHEGQAVEVLVGGLGDAGGRGARAGEDPLLVHLALVLGVHEHLGASNVDCGVVGHAELNKQKCISVPSHPGARRDFGDLAVRHSPAH